MKKANHIFLASCLLVGCTVCVGMKKRKKISLRKGNVQRGQKRVRRPVRRAKRIEKKIGSVAKKKGVVKVPQLRLAKVKQTSSPRATLRKSNTVGEIIYTPRPGAPEIKLRKTRSYDRVLARKARQRAKFGKRVKKKSGLGKTICSDPMVDYKLH